jgi:hypothetical protein
VIVEKIIQNKSRKKIKLVENWLGRQDQ